MTVLPMDTHGIQRGIALAIIIVAAILIYLIFARAPSTAPDRPSWQNLSLEAQKAEIMKQVNVKRSRSGITENEKSAQKAAILKLQQSRAR